MDFFDGLGGTIENLLLKAGDIWSGLESQKLQAETLQAQAAANAAVQQTQAESKRLLYLGIGVVGAALLISLTRRAAG